MKTFWHLGALAALAGLCMAPSDCDPDPTTNDADASDAAGEADAGTNANKTPRQIDSSSDCQSRGACNKANAIAFSQTECENNNTIDGERADSLNCTTAFDAYLACVAAITYNCAQTLDIQIQAACNDLYQAYGTCLSNPPR